MKNKKIWLAVISVIAIILIAIGLSYAYWLVTAKQEKTNTITATCLSISISGESNDIELLEQFPITDDEGKKLTPYEFTIVNNCSTSVDYHVNLESIGTKAISIKPGSIKAMLNDNTPKKLSRYVGTDTTLSDAYEAYILGYGTLASKGSATYKLKLWIDENAMTSEINKSYTSKITVSVGQGINAQGTTLASLILKNAETNNYLYSTAPSFSQVTAEGEYGLYQAQDVEGTSYYFRGDVNNNYVKFGKWSSDDENHADEDMIWRIIRINGNGTIRMIYDGTTAVKNGTKHDASIGNSAYAEVTSDVKSMYYYDETTNSSSLVKTFIENWYTNNLETTYGKYISDELFCMDRKIHSYNESNNETAFAAGNRSTPQLYCDQTTDYVSVANERLTKPIGLITADEAVMAGITYAGGASSYYLYSGSEFDTLTPYMYYWNIASDNGDVLGYSGNQYYIDSAGIIDAGYSSITERTVRPVINIKADVSFEGTGEIGSPYQIVME